MTGILRPIILGVSASALLGSAAMALVHTGALREVIRLAVGVMMILSLLLPVSKLHFSLPLDWMRNHTQSVSKQVEQVQQQRKGWMAESSAKEVSTYMMHRARAEGIECEIKIQASMVSEDTVSLDHAEIRASLTPEQAEKIAAMLETECGIPRGNQTYVEN